MNVVERIAGFLIRWRFAYLAVCAVITIVAIAGMGRLQLRTIFSDLLPLYGETVKVFDEFREFGNPLEVQVLIEAKEGDVYNIETLRKIFRLHQKVDLLPAVDHDRVISIASEKLRVTRATPTGVASVPVMNTVNPESEDDVRITRDNIQNAPDVLGIYVSSDGKAARIRATFYEDDIVYEDVFTGMRQILAEEQDETHNVYAAGRVMEIGWVLHFGTQSLWITGLSLLMLFLMLALYLRSIAGIITPFTVAMITSIWSLGAWGWAGMNIEPLTLVVPVLVIARALSHAVQATERYYEFLAEEAGNKVEAARRSLISMLPPGTLGVLTDAAGLYIIAVIPMPMLYKLAVLSGTWALTMIPGNVILTPLLLSILPAPKDVEGYVNVEQAKSSWDRRAILEMLRLAARSVSPARRGITAAIVGGLGLLAMFGATNLQVGNVTVGSALLWPEHDFNVAMHRINDHMAGNFTLDVVWDGVEHGAMKSPQAHATMLDFQQRIEAMQGAQQTVSVADKAQAANRLANGGHPKWLPVDLRPDETAGAVNMLFIGSNVKNLAHLVSPTLQDGVVSLWYRDLKTETVRGAMSSARRVIADMEEDLPKGEEGGEPPFRVKLATGAVALQAVMDEVIAVAEVRMGIALPVLIVGMAATAYGSFVAGIILVVPIILATLFVAGMMWLMGLGLDVNTIPVSAIGAGIGIDYGIYLLSRMCEEYQKAPGSGEDRYERTILRSLYTSGKAIFFTASTVLMGLVSWYFLSDLKFLADMGLLLVMVLFFNMIMALVVIPLLVSFIQPKFLSRVRLLAGGH